MCDTDMLLCSLVESNMTAVKDENFPNRPVPTVLHCCCARLMLSSYYWAFAVFTWGSMVGVCDAAVQHAAATRAERAG